MEQNKFQLLEKYLDNELSATEKAEADSLLGNDPEMKLELAALHASAEATCYYGISQDVKAIQQEYLANTQSTSAAPARIRYMMRPAMRIAASVIVLVMAFGIYKYSTLSASSVYNEYYTSYELNRARGASTTSQLENAYNNKDWKSVAQLAEQMTAPGSKELFLSGLANLELSQPVKAISAFDQVLAINQRTQSDYFQDEAEYYLAISYIRNNQAGMAIPILKNIKADKAHLYHQKAGEISLLDLKMLSWKNK